MVSRVSPATTTWMRGPGVAVEMAAKVSLGVDVDAIGVVAVVEIVTDGRRSIVGENIGVGELVGDGVGVAGRSVACRGSCVALGAAD